MWVNGARQDRCRQFGRTSQPWDTRSPFPREPAFSLTCAWRRLISTVSQLTLLPAAGPRNLSSRTRDRPPQAHSLVPTASSSNRPFPTTRPLSMLRRPSSLPRLSRSRSSRSTTSSCPPSRLLLPDRLLLRRTEPLVPASQRRSESSRRWQQRRIDDDVLPPPLLPLPLPSRLPLYDTAVSPSQTSATPTATCTTDGPRYLSSLAVRELARRKARDARKTRSSEA